MRRLLLRLGIWLAKRGGWRVPRDLILRQCLLVGVEQEFLVEYDADDDAIVMREYAIMPVASYRHLRSLAGLPPAETVPCPSWEVRL